MCLLPDLIQMDLAESGVNEKKKHLGLEVIEFIGSS